MLKVGLVEDIEEIRTLQEKFLNAQPDIDVVLSSGSMEDFIQKLDNLPKQPAIIISDIGLPGMSGIEGVQLIKRKYPEIEVIIVSIYTDTDNIYKALCSGAVGYLMKNTPMNELKEAIFTVQEGGSPMTPSIARKVIQHFSPVKRDEENDLSTKELQVVQCIVKALVINYVQIVCRFPSILFVTTFEISIPNFVLTAKLNLSVDRYQVALRVLRLVIW